MTEKDVKIIKDVQEINRIIEEKIKRKKLILLNGIKLVY